MNVSILLSFHELNVLSFLRKESSQNGQRHVLVSAVENGGKSIGKYLGKSTNCSDLGQVKMNHVPDAGAADSDQTGQRTHQMISRHVSGKWWGVEGAMKRRNRRKTPELDSKKKENLEENGKTTVEIDKCWRGEARKKRRNRTKLPGLNRKGQNRDQR